MLGEVPGEKARHAVVTDLSRKNRGDDGAMEVAVEQLTDNLEKMLVRWPIGDGVRFHFVLYVQYPPDKETQNEETQMELI
jgi:hypothetical protein